MLCSFNTRLKTKSGARLLTSTVVRTVIELIKNESYYQSMYSQFNGPVDIAIKTVCKNFAFSEIYEICCIV